MYRDALEWNELNYEIFLAISDKAYVDNFHQTAIQHSVQKHKLKLVVVDTEEEQVLEWIN